MAISRSTQQQGSIYQQPVSAPSPVPVQAPAPSPVTNPFAKKEEKPWWESGYGLAYGQAPGADNPWLKAQLKQNELGQQSAYDTMRANQSSQMATNLSALARQGGLGGGAAERMANQSQYQAMIGGQQIGMKGAMNEQALRAADYENMVKRGAYEDQMRAAKEAADAYALGNNQQGKIEGIMDKAGNIISSTGQNVANFAKNPIAGQANYAKGIWDDIGRGNIISAAGKTMTLPIGGGAVGFGTNKPKKNWWEI